MLAAGRGSGYAPFAEFGANTQDTQSFVISQRGAVFLSCVIPGVCPTRAQRGVRSGTALALESQDGANYLQKQLFKVINNLQKMEKQF